MNKKKIFIVGVTRYDFYIFGIHVESAIRD